MNGDRVDARLKSKKASVIPFKRRHPLAKVDFSIENHGSVVLVRPNTRAAIEWADENIGAGNGFQPYYPCMVFEPRYVDQVINMIRQDGLRFC
jgi:hypothetical protein